MNDSHGNKIKTKDVVLVLTILALAIYGVVNIVANFLAWITR